MGKFLLELVLFTGILYQISVLAGYKGQQSDIAAKHSPVISQSVEAMYKGTSYTMDPSKVTPAKRNASILQEMARAEAERIVKTGDYESLYRRFEENETTLKMIGGAL